METVLNEGRLSFDFRLAALLSSILEEKRPGLTVLRFCNFDIGHSGEIVIKKGRWICGAKLNGVRRGKESTGYEALRQLCEVTNADFCYVDKPQHLPSLTLNIELARILKHIPGLPEDQSVLQNDELILDTIFNPNATSDCLPVRPTGENFASLTDTTNTHWNEAELPLEPVIEQSFPSLDPNAIKETAQHNILVREAEEKRRAATSARANFGRAVKALTRSIRWFGATAVLFFCVVLIGAITQFGIYTFSNSSSINDKPGSQMRPAYRLRPRSLITKKPPAAKSVISHGTKGGTMTVDSAQPAATPSNVSPTPDVSPTQPGTPRRRAYQTY